MFVDVSAKTQAEPRRPARVDPAARRGRGAQGQPGHGGLRRRRRVQARPGPRRRRDRCSSSAARCKVGDAVVAGAHWGRVRAMHDYKGDKRQAGRAPASRSRSSASTPSPRPASSSAWSRTTARRASSRASARTRLKIEPLARRGGKKFSLEDDLRPRARRAGQRAQPRAQGRRLGLARGLRGRDRQAAAGRGHRSRSSTPASAASRSPTSTWPPRPTRSSSASTSARSARPRQLADREGVEIRTYSVIYRAIDELRDAMQGMLAPEEVEETVGTLEVRADLPRLARSASSPAAWSPTGKSPAAPRCRLVRDGTIVYDGEIDSLRRFNDDVREVQTGFECGIVLKDYMDVKEGDVHRGLRDPAGRAHPLVVRCRARLRRPPAGPSLLSRVRLAEGASEPSSTASRRICASAIGASVAEVDHQDTWQRSTLAVALAGGSPARCEGAADDVGRYARRALPAGRARRAAAGLLG